MTDYTKDQERESQRERDALKARVAELEKERAEVVEKCCFASDEERQSVLGGISLADHIRRRIDNLAGQRDKAEETNRNNLRVSSDLLDSKIKQMEHVDQDLQAARRERDVLKARVAELEAKHCACDAHGPCLKHTDGWLEQAKELLAEQDDAPPTVAATREVWEAMLLDAETRAIWSARVGGGEGPLNPAADLVVAIHQMLMLEVGK